jgi:hypothetical protein
MLYPLSTAAFVQSHYQDCVLMHTLHLFFKLCRLQLSPQQLPFSLALCYTQIFLYALVSMGSAWIAMTMEEALLFGFLDTSLQIVLISSLLIVFQHSQRIIQTLTAFFGANNFISIVLVPANFFSYDNHLQNIQGLADIFLLAAFIWLIFVISHIMRHAVNGNLLTGLIITFLITLFSDGVLQQFFPQG